MISKRILCVDDGQEHERLYSEVLKSKRYAVGVAANPKNAMALFTSNDFDLVIMNHELGGMKGDELAILMKGLKPSVPILFLTHAISPETEADDLHYYHRGSGVEALLSKVSTLVAANSAKRRRIGKMARPKLD